MCQPRLGFDGVPPARTQQQRHGKEGLPPGDLELVRVAEEWVFLQAELTAAIMARCARALDDFDSIHEPVSGQELWRE